jgi:hypothetical protein
MGVHTPFLHLEGEPTSRDSRAAKGVEAPELVLPPSCGSESGDAGPKSRSGKLGWLGGEGVPQATQTRFRTRGTIRLTLSTFCGTSRTAALTTTYYDLEASVCNVGHLRGASLSISTPW